MVKTNRNDCLDRNILFVIATIESHPFGTNTSELKESLIWFKCDLSDMSIYYSLLITFYSSSVIKSIKWFDNRPDRVGFLIMDVLD